MAGPLSRGESSKISLFVLILCSSAMPALAATEVPRVAIEVAVSSKLPADANASAQLKDRLTVRLREE